MDNPIRGLSTRHLCSSNTVSSNHQAITEAEVAAKDRKRQRGYVIERKHHFYASATLRYASSESTGLLMP
jgi:hypothetical protein